MAGLPVTKVAGPMDQAGLHSQGDTGSIPGLPKQGGGSIEANSSSAGSAVVAGQKVGSVFQCDKFSGADVSIKANACNEAAVAAGGGTIDLRELLAGNTTGSEEIEINTRAGDKALAGVTALFPTSGIYSTDMVGGPVVEATVYGVKGKPCGKESGSNNNVGDTLTVVQEGFAYTGIASGATFKVLTVGPGGCVLTVGNASGVSGLPVTAGSGYLTSKYATTTSSNGSAKPPMLNVQASDCGIRLNGRGTIETGSVGAGATSFWVTPSSKHSGFMAEAMLCTDEGAGYVRTDGGFKTLNRTKPAYNTGTGKITGGAWLTAATALIRGVVDHSQFNLLETSSGQDNGAWIDGACCGTNFYSLHTNAGDGQFAGYPIIVGSGGVIQNACITKGSNVIRAPYAHFTAKYLGFILQAGSSTGSTGFPADTIITGINSLTSVTVSANATGTTNSTNALCTQLPLTTPVPETAGTGLTIALTDPTAANNWAISLYQPVANGAGPGLENMLFNYGDGEVNVYGAYEEANGFIDKYTPLNYIAYQADFVNFYSPFGTVSHSKYFIQADTKYGWSVYNGFIGDSGIEDQGVVHKPLSPTDGFTYVKGGIPYAVNGGNLLPDTDLKQSTAYWTVPHGVDIAGGVGPLGDNGFTYALSETQGENIYIFVPVPITNLQANSYYTMGVWANLTSATTGNIYLNLCSKLSVSSCTALFTSPAFPSRQRNNPGMYSALFSTGSNTSGYFAIELSHFKGSGRLSLADPFLVAGNIPIYQENDGGVGSSTGAGSSFSSITIKGAGAGTYAKADGTGFGTPGGLTTCFDISGSGTAQSCTPSAPVGAGMCMAYTAGKNNAGSSLTLNATGTALPVAKWQGRTTALLPGDITAGVPVVVCLNYPTASLWTVESSGNIPAGAGASLDVVAGSGMSEGGTPDRRILNAQRFAFGYCTGTAPSNAKNLVLYGLGSFSTNCSSTNSQASLYMAPTSGTVSDLAISCGTSGVSETSGVFTLYDYPNGGGEAINTGLTVTYGTTAAKNVVRDTTHTHSYSAGDRFVVTYTTKANETLANCNASFVY